MLHMISRQNILLVQSVSIFKNLANGYTLDALCLYRSRSLPACKEKIFHSELCDAIQESIADVSIDAVVNH